MKNYFLLGLLVVSVPLLSMEDAAITDDTSLSTNKPSDESSSSSGNKEEQELEFGPDDTKSSDSPTASTENTALIEDQSSAEKTPGSQDSSSGSGSTDVSSQTLGGDGQSGATVEDAASAFSPRPKQKFEPDDFKIESEKLASGTYGDEIHQTAQESANGRNTYEQDYQDFAKAYSQGINSGDVATLEKLKTQVEKLLQQNPPKTEEERPSEISEEKEQGNGRFVTMTRFTTDEDVDPAKDVVEQDKVKLGNAEDAIEKKLESLSVDTYDSSMSNEDKMQYLFNKTRGEQIKKEYNEKISSLKDKTYTKFQSIDPDGDESHQYDYFPMEEQEAAIERNKEKIGLKSQRQQALKDGYNDFKSQYSSSPDEAKRFIDYYEKRRSEVSAKGRSLDDYKNTIKKNVDYYTDEDNRPEYIENYAEDGDTGYMRDNQDEIDDFNNKAKTYGEMTDASKETEAQRMYESQFDRLHSDLENNYNKDEVQPRNELKSNIEQALQDGSAFKSLKTKTYRDDWIEEKQEQVNSVFSDDQETKKSLENKLKELTEYNSKTNRRRRGAKKRLKRLFTNSKE